MGFSGQSAFVHILIDKYVINITIHRRYRVGETSTKESGEKERIVRIGIEGMRDIEMLRTILSVITESLQNLKTPSKELLGTITEAVRGMLLVEMLESSIDSWRVQACPRILW